LLLFPHVARPDLVYPMLIVNVLPSGLIGLLVAGFVAAAMTSVASMLNSASTLITMDLAHRARPALANERIVAIGRLSTGLCLLIAVLWAPQLERLPSLWQYLQAMLAYAVPPVVALFVVGLFWRGANAAGANAAFLYGSLCGVALFVANVVFHATNIHFLYVAPILFTVDVGILVAASVWHRSPEPAGLEALHWSRSAYRAETVRLATAPLWRNYRLQSLVLLALAAWVVIAFR